ncbi:MAG: hypothetical protein HKN42_03835 [Granulosicoccus sp.]|nr:hypothetical protein [Granulosicoccus sp.]
MNTLRIVVDTGHRRVCGFARVVMVALALSGCASGPIETGQAPAEFSLAEARQLISDEQSLSMPDSEPVLWGGIVLNTQNLAESTQIEIMGYPLDRRQRPMTGRDAQGRFLAVYPGYLETVDYAAGRVVTVFGPVNGVTTGTVGESTYIYPTVLVEQIHLWQESASYPRTGITFGIGINIEN